MSDIKVNDRVIYIDEPKGVVGTVVSVTPAGSSPYVSVDVAWDDDTQAAYRQSDLLVVSKPPKPDVPGGAFKATDRVFYTETGSEDTGTVKAIRPVGSGRKTRFEYMVAWDNGDEADWYTAGQLTRVL